MQPTDAYYALVCAPLLLGWSAACMLLAMKNGARGVTGWAGVRWGNRHGVRWTGLDWLDCTG
jgi:hypothetical protein